jgi:Ca-activated chloride channel family protein
VYAASLQPDVLLLNEDRHLLSKHRFVVEPSNPKSALVFKASALVHPADASGAFLTGGFAGLDEVAHRLPRAEPPRPLPAAGSAPVELPRPASAPAESAPIEADFHVSARLVEVYATVKDNRGRYLDDLTAGQFTLLDERRPQPIAAFESQGSEVSCALLLDTTGSMQLALPALKGAALKLIADLRPADSAAVYSFSESVVELQPLTTDKAAASRAVVRTHAQGDTALYDALTQITHDLAGRPGKKVIVLFTDGKDNASTLTADSAINRAKLAGIPVYTIAEGEAVAEPALIAQLAGISKATGGEAFVIRSAGEISRVFEKVSEDLAHGYLLSFPPPPVEKNEWRSIEVTVQPKGAKVHAREGYFPLPDSN